ncbi:metallophosphoesterase [bacterium]|nr:metallophosphoesterase [bacterium]MBP9806869.1 metallophosphoesterase [bacterium]
MVKWFNLIISLHCLFVCGNAAIAQHQVQPQVQHQGQPHANKQNSPFIVKPYLQLGLEAKSDATAATVVWFTSNDSHKWSASVKSGKATEYRPAESILERLIALPGFSSPIKKYTARLKKLTPGEGFQYQIKQDGALVFEATATAKKSAAQPFKVAIFGDCGENTNGQREIANEVFKAKPDFVLIPGDIVYRHGLYSQYLTNYFPIYNLDQSKESASKALSAPMLRSIFTVGVLGNHDLGLDGDVTNFDKHNDAMAYFLFWDQPLNGFGTKYGEKNTPPITGSENKQILFKKSVGDAYPQMANFSFDYGNAHWTVLDGNYYMDWSDEKTRKWLIEDLKKAQSATWRFVSFHQPAFSIDMPHGNEQRMRLISDILSKYKVDMVFAGHAHCYERSFPLNFAAKDGARQLSMHQDGTVDGAFAIDHNFDGLTKTKPAGIIHIVTGAGGARLYPQGSPSDYILKYDSSDYSYTNMEVVGKTVTIKQINSKGKVIDHFTVTK